MPEIPLPGLEPPANDPIPLRAPTKPKPALHVVHSDSGEVCPGCVERDELLEKTTTESRGWFARYNNLKRNAEQKARANELWPRVVAIHRYYRELTGSRAELRADDFHLAEPYVTDYGDEACREAIEGAAHDPYVTRRANGTIKKHNGWDLIFRNPEKFDEMRRRAPAEPSRLRIALTEGIDALTGVAREIATRAFLLADEQNPSERRQLIAEINDLCLRTKERR